MPQQWFSVVINNPTPEDEVCMNTAKTIGWLVEGQLEKGKNGTPHYQLAVGTHESWKAVKSMFPRANIQEAEDPEALRKYVIKKDTRVVDFTPPKREKTHVKKQTTADFYDAVFEEAYLQFGDAADELIKNDNDMKTYDLAVNQLIVETGYDTAVRATRPDVRSAYRKYRYAMWSVWYHKNIPNPEETIEVETIQDADDNALSGDEDASTVEAESAECTDNEEAPSEDEGSGDEGTEASDSEGD